MQKLIPADVDEEILESLITVSKQIADGYCNNPFYERNEDGTLVDANGDELEFDDDGELVEGETPVEIAIPGAVKVGVLQLLNKLWSSYKSDEQLTAGPVVTEKTGERTITLMSWSEAYGDAGMEIPLIVEYILTQYRYAPGY